jgi:hypothetical protein
VKTGRKLTAMISSEKNSAGPDLLGGVGNQLPVGLFPAVVLDVLVGVFDHDDGTVHHGAHGDGDATQAHDVGVDALLHA